MRIAFIGSKSLYLAAWPPVFDDTFNSKFFDASSEEFSSKLVYEIELYNPEIVVIFDPVAHAKKLEIILEPLSSIIVFYLTFLCQENLDEDYQNQIQIIDRLAERKSKNEGTRHLWIGSSKKITSILPKNIPTWSLQCLAINDEIYSMEKKDFSHMDKPLILVDHTDDIKKILTESRLNKLKSENFCTISSLLNGLDYEKRCEEHDSVINISTAHQEFVTYFALQTLAQDKLFVSKIFINYIGLFPGCEYLEMQKHVSLDELLLDLNRLSFRTSWVKARGHEYSQKFKASQVWHRMLTSILVQSQERKGD